jgi:hypothetical protein
MFLFDKENCTKNFIYNHAVDSIQESHLGINLIFVLFRTFWLGDLDADLISCTS